MDADTNYILNFCDSLLGQTSFREYRFPFLVGDRGKTLPVASFYPDLNLVVELLEEQSPEAASPGDTKTLGRRPSDQYRYDQRKRDVLLEHGISLIELYLTDFPHDGQGRLKRFPTGIREVLEGRLEPFVPSERVLVRN